MKSSTKLLIQAVIQYRINACLIKLDIVETSADFELIENITTNES